MVRGGGPSRVGPTPPLVQMISTSPCGGGPRARAAGAGTTASALLPDHGSDDLDELLRAGAEALGAGGGNDDRVAPATEVRLAVDRSARLHHEARALTQLHRHHRGVAAARGHQGAVIAGATT